MFAEVGIDLDLQVGERSGDDLGRLDRTLEVAGDQYIGGQLGRPGESLSQSLGLLLSQWRESGACAKSTDHPVHGDVRFTVADQNEGRRVHFGGGGHGW